MAGRHCGLGIPARSWVIVCLALATARGNAALAQAPAAAPAVSLALPEMDVVGSAPLAGSGVSRADVPGNTIALDRRDLIQTGPASALRALNEQSGSVAIDDAQGNLYSPILLFRGYEASSLVGDPQGLAVYVNGTRFNAPFGDTVNWDLIPDIAIDRLEVVGSNPVFGLNALGGAVSVRLRDGFSYHGGEAEAFGGFFGRRQSSLQYGVQSGNVAAYVAATGLEEDGWRVASPSRLRQIYGTIGWRGDGGELDLDITAANNHLAGNGTTPVELLAVQRNAVFTYPDATRNAYLNVRLRGDLEVSDSVTLQAAAYALNFSQRTANGDAADVGPAGDGSGTLTLQGSGTLTDRNGRAVADFLNGGPYGVLNATGTDTNGFGASLQGLHTSEPLGRRNRLTLGVSYDGGRSVFSSDTALGVILPGGQVQSDGVVIDQPDQIIAPVRVDAANDYYGIYASDLLDVTDHLALTVSGRFNAAVITLRDRSGGQVSGDHSFTRFNPAIGVTYQVLPWLNAYAGYSEANRSPTPAELSCASAASPCTLGNVFVNDPSLKQVVARTVEAGLRGQAHPFGEAGWLGGGTVTWHAGLFRAENSDDILFAASEVIGRGYFRNIGDTRRQGAEAGLRLQTGRLAAYADYTLTDATFQSAISLVSQDNPLADANGSIAVKPGDRLPGIPAHNVKFGVEYHATEAWTVGLTGQAASGRVLRGDESNQNPHTNPYAAVAVNTSYQVTANVQVFGKVENAFNTRYETFGAFSPTGSVPIQQVPGASNPRSLTPAPPVAGYGGVRVRF